MTHEEIAQLVPKTLVRLSTVIHGQEPVRKCIAISSANWSTNVSVEPRLTVCEPVLLSCTNKQQL